jgi:hypothetical protein
MNKVFVFFLSVGPKPQWQKPAGTIARPRMQIAPGGGDAGVSEGGLHQVNGAPRSRACEAWAWRNQWGETGSAMLGQPLGGGSAIHKRPRPDPTGAQAGGACRSTQKHPIPSFARTADPCAGAAGSFGFRWISSSLLFQRECSRRKLGQMEWF